MIKWLKCVFILIRYYILTILFEYFYICNKQINLLHENEFMIWMMYQGSDYFLCYFCFHQYLSSFKRKSTKLCVSMSWMQNSFASLAAYWTPSTGWAGPAGHSAASVSSSRSALFVCLRGSRRLRGSATGLKTERLIYAFVPLASLQTACSRTNGSHG